MSGEHKGGVRYASEPYFGAFGAVGSADPPEKTNKTNIKELVRNSNKTPQTRARLHTTERATERTHLSYSLLKIACAHPPPPNAQDAASNASRGAMCSNFQFKSSC